MSRTATIKRDTFETQIELTLDLDEQTPIKVDTGIGYIDHMLTLFAKHGRFGLQVDVKGDLQVDSHHTTEDIGIVLGEAFTQALGDKVGIERYGAQFVPMDETLTRAVIDLSGRSYLVLHAELTTPTLGTFETEVVEDFWQGLADQARANVHIEVLYGRNTHHKIESMFKAVGRAMRQAVTINPEIKGVNSTKGRI
ncbi:imidazoleglycerol-phosphate dehydratase [Leuconostoc mesenteroides subsp. mesenteroides]|uniref:imidazoleglycerol-phosphate dehydratase HisB n=1 Tax=Leuconostoc mesenteroides TaxID=1245 RepID=UPI000A05133C|nr:imidazoleglycerol-phosphate dehydratase HisB [Leuconostoc mesenteroides]ARN64006.1 imidazoleglycerol-phosphate dehydratase [Leuconostoc mesenteroides subsp. mesenteroides]MDV8927511.1 imidazoleglycerol-phosphate dehydratase HisB [Leuconostoc mesenteroides]ORI91291.1 imidazoleglycerol-phosphate dehydratase [Leuconostoc mesenteroides subsp. mesenteroides]ORI92204.1 imidazoleglycerol-phosphate dehydratase [Leuconostoc mesenteroides subsp. mesenteroides]